MKIIYIHHANRQKGNPPGPQDDLTQLGYQDAELTAKLMKGVKNLKAIYTSTAFRCKTTANIVNKNHNVPIIEDDRLEEYGTWDKTGESWVDLQKRIMQAIKDIVFKYDEDDSVIIVTSGVNIVGFTNIVYGLEPSTKAPYLGVPSCSPLIFNIDKNHFN